MTKDIIKKIIELMERWSKGAMTGELVIGIPFIKGEPQCIDVTEHVRIKLK
jgi:hypothetical protein